MVSTQWNPNDVQWGNISWGHAVSKDLTDWTDVGGWRGDKAAAIVTGPESYDSKGIFSGTAHSVNLMGESDGTLLAFYASVSALPTAWNVGFSPFIFGGDGGEGWKLI
jgi:beta-fructofuranosidase